MSRSINITSEGQTRVLNVATGVGPKGDPGPIGPIAGAIISATPPENPDDGDGWLDSTTGIVSYWNEAQQVWVAIPPTGETPVDGETTETILEKLQGTAADPERIGAEYLPEIATNAAVNTAIEDNPAATRAAAGLTSALTTVPLSALHAVKIINPTLPNNNFILYARTPGASINGYQFQIAIGGSEIVFTNPSGNLWIATVPNPTLSADLLDAINEADDPFPFYAKPFDNMTGNITLPLTAQTLEGGNNGTAGTLGERKYATISGNVAIFECVQEDPPIWIPACLVSGTTIVSENGSFSLADGADHHFCVIGSAVTSLTINPPLSANIRKGQVVSLVSESDIDTLRFFDFNAAIIGDVVNSILANTVYTWVCVDNIPALTPTFQKLP
jgi:hypothetical protein